MFKTYVIYIIIPVTNGRELIKKSLQSILDQTYSRKELRVLFIDNCSSDGSYEQILEYVSKYSELVSVYRMKRVTTQARLIKQAVEYLRFSQVHFSMFLNPGDTIYPEFIKEAINIFHMKKSVNSVVSGIDIEHVDGSIEKQHPIFTDDCILDKVVNSDLFFTAGIGAKVQRIFRYLPFGLAERLVDVEKMIDLHDWLSMAYPKRGKMAILSANFGSMLETKVDVIFDLMTKAYSLKSQFYLTETKENKVIQERKLTEVSDMEAAYRTIAMDALFAAVRAGTEGDHDTVRKCLVFAEMMWLLIKDEELYVLIEEAEGNPDKFSSLIRFTEVETVKPPKDCFIF